MTVERRRHPRVQVDVVVQITGGDETVSGRLRDISIDATLVEATRAWPVGTSVALGFELPDGGGQLGLTGTVIRVADGEQLPPAMAVLFTDLPPAAATRIDLFMDGQDHCG